MGQCCFYAFSMFHNALSILYCKDARMNNLTISHLQPNLAGETLDAERLHLPFRPIRLPQKLIQV